MADTDTDTTTDRLDGLDHVLGAPPNEGRLEMVVRRPAEDEREILDDATLEPGAGLVGDRWSAQAKRSPLAEITLMNARCAELVAGSRDRWPLAGDQLYVDLDLAEENLPPGSRLRVGSALLEVSEKPHRGCAKFSARFGEQALRFVNSPAGRAARLRGVNAIVVEAGTVRPGDAVTKA